MCALSGSSTSSRSLMAGVA